LVEKLKKAEISSSSLLSSFHIVSMYTNSEVEAAETSRKKAIKKCVLD
jgi:hypothetical protein